MITKSANTPADALPQHWTERLPAPLRPYAQLSRLDRPIGWQLLLLPCWMGLALSAVGHGFYHYHLSYAAAFLLGAIAMRGAGCTYNDILDRDIDAQVARTRTRPLPSGAVSMKRAWGWLLAQCLVGLLVLLTLPRFAQILALIALPLVALYPLMKRVTWWPQAWLGLVFSSGALVSAAAASTPSSLSPAIMLLYAGCIAWVIGYDTIYALQDREDDALIGVRSTARLFGARWRLWTTVFYILAILFWALAATLAGAGLVFAIALSAIGALVIWPMLSRINDNDPGSALAAFKSNAKIGALITIAFALEPAWRTLRPLIQS